MVQTTALIDTLKQALKSHRLTYAQIAQKLDMSEANIKMERAPLAVRRTRLEK